MGAGVSSETITLKRGDLFFLSESGGDVPLERGHGVGLFYHDCRFLNGYTLRIGGQKAELHSSGLQNGHTAFIRLLSPELEIHDRQLAAGTVEICWSRELSGEQLALIDVITLRSLTSEGLCFPLTLRFQSEFEDLFTLRGMTQKTRGCLHPPQWKNGELIFLYEGADAIDRGLRVSFASSPQGAAVSKPPLIAEGGRPGDRPSLKSNPGAESGSQVNAAHFQIELEPEESWELRISLVVSESPPRGMTEAPSKSVTSRLSKEKTCIRTDNESFNRILDRSLGDLNMLRSGSGHDGYFAAGVPWYVALFGRDSIITAIQMLAYDATIAEATIRLLARYQGKEVNEWRDEEPGKILHELRVGEMANLNEIPHTPYYGTIDATPLWLILVGRHAAWTGDLRVFRELRPSIEAALQWIDHYGDFDGDGYVEYQSKSAGGLVNQGWKDSGDGIVNADGSLGEPPIALVEVQGYVYRAKLEIAVLYQKTGDQQRAALLKKEAQQLRERFNRDFWMEGGYFALALQKNKDRVEVLSSNAGQALWSGIAGEEQARRTAEQLLSPEMFSGWGIRTLSARAVRYNPLGYHTGTIWPHDNSLIVAAFKHYGLDAAALVVARGLIEAAKYFSSCRLPELFGGFPREDGAGPRPYPIACEPQAWAAATIPFLITALLGLEPDPFENRLRIVHPTLPENVDRMHIRNLRVGNAEVDLLFERGVRGVVVTAGEIRGELQVIADS